MKVLVEDFRYDNKLKSYPFKNLIYYTDIKTVEELNLIIKNVNLGLLRICDENKKER